MAELGFSVVNSREIHLKRVLLEGRGLFDILCNELAGVLAYATTGVDPQMTLYGAGEDQPFQLQKKRYRFIFQARITKGRISQPRLYLDFGHGFSESPESNIFLARAAADTWICEFIPASPVLQIRFDPSESATRFSLLRLELEEFVDNESGIRDAIYRGSKAFYQSLPVRTQSNRFLQAAKNAIGKRIFARERERELERLSLAPAAISGTNALNAVQRGANPEASGRYCNVYHELMSGALSSRSPSYAPLKELPVFVRESDPKVLAFYLPQFHPFKENDAWWGTGFTEWTNVAKAVPQFAGHYQPRQPGELGFYDLRIAEVMKRQFALARHYGIDGFCFHYYWFAGHRLMERPLEELLANKSEDMTFPFCLCWANENWTRRWDGADHDVLMQQSHTPEDHRAVFQDLLRYIQDDRYIRVNGKPIIVVYRPAIITDVALMVNIWRDEAIAAGLPGLYLVATTAFSFNDPASIGFDALVQFPPHAVSVADIHEEVDIVNDSFDGAIYDYNDTVDAYVDELGAWDGNEEKQLVHPGVMMAWDNEARKPGRGHVFHRATPAKFFDWFKYAMNWSAKNNLVGEQLVFINAWNEWAEGTYLEPDRKMGYAYLTSVGAVREERFGANGEAEYVVASHQRPRTEGVETVILLHLYYTDLAPEFAKRIAEMRQDVQCDLILTLSDKINVETLQSVIDLLQPTRIVLCKNQGRDVWPFIAAARLAEAMGYKVACKLHSKKSLHLQSGNEWRHSLLDALTAADNASKAIDCLRSLPNIGVVAPTSAMALTSDSATMRDNRSNVDKLLSRFTENGVLQERFVAGTMFWLKLEAFGKLLKSDLREEDFGPELGAIDGTIAHAFERVLTSIAADSGFSVEWFSPGEGNSPYTTFAA